MKKSKTLNSVNRWRKGRPLSPGDNRRLDDLWLNLKAGVYTVALVGAFIWLLCAAGCF